MINYSDWISTLQCTKTRSGRLLQTVIPNASAQNFNELFRWNMKHWSSRQFRVWLHWRWRINSINKIIDRLIIEHRASTGFWSIKESFLRLSLNHGWIIWTRRCMMMEHQLLHHNPLPPDHHKNQVPINQNYQKVQYSLPRQLMLINCNHINNWSVQLNSKFS